MITAFIAIRFKQIIRALADLGLLRVLFLGGAMVFVAVYFFKLTELNTTVYYAVGFYLSIIISMQIRRGDKFFLKSHFSRYQLILISEYLIFALPLFGCLTYNSQWQPLLISLAIIATLPFIDIRMRQRSLNTRFQNWIPMESFEWKAGVRKRFFPLFVIWLAGLATSFFIASVPIVLFTLGVMMFSFYEQGEPLEMLVARELNARQLLWQKIKMQVLLFSVVSFPLMAAFTIFHYDRWYIVLVEFLILISLHVYIILTKYTFYEPARKSSGPQIFGAIGAMGAVIPLLIPVVWILSVWLYHRSLKNLNIYLDDYH